MWVFGRRNACWNTMRLGLYQVACKTTLEQVEGQAEALAFQLLDQLGDVVRAGYTGIAETFQAMATELGKVCADPPAHNRGPPGLSSAKGLLLDFQPQMVHHWHVG